MFKFSIVANFSFRSTQWGWQRCHHLHNPVSLFSSQRAGESSQRRPWPPNAHEVSCYLNLVMRWCRTINNWSTLFLCCRHFCPPAVGGEDTANSTLDHTLPPLSARARDLLCSHQLLSQDRSCPQKTPTLEDCLEIGVNSSLASPSCPHTFDSPLCLPSTSGD